MNIYNIYLKKAKLYLNTSLVSVLFSLIYILLNLFFFSEKKLMTLVLPFLLYSIYLFQLYLYQYKKSINTDADVVHKQHQPSTFESNMQFIIYHEKEPRNLLLFNPSGLFVGRIFSKTNHNHRLNHGKPKEFILEDHAENILATYYCKDNIVDVYQPESGYIGGLVCDNETTVHDLPGENKNRIRQAKIFLDDQIINPTGKVIFRVRKGWMPIRSQKVFQTPNSPIITVDQNVDSKEKVLYFSIVIKRYLAK
jgi:Ca2+/Na+ antiporter